MSTPTLPLLDRLPREGEQYRFHFDMAKCIGCKCCVVACNEHNSNPADINWRRVGEVEGGIFPATQRLHLSMGCNHCAEPTCLAGCPVEAYTKDALTGIVDHSADLCIGCQYCVWNCSYDVPQYDAARGVVGKCDMCHSRINEGENPACANACPEGAIAIEIVDINQWRKHHPEADAPGMPLADHSLSTTRISQAPGAFADLQRVDLDRIEPEPSHWSLVFVLVLMQAAAGAILAGVSHWVAFALINIALSIAPLHLGRPLFAYRAWRGWRTSWLSREVIAFSLFAGAAALPDFRYGAAIIGLIATYCSARIYMVPARPSWNSNFTVFDFYGTVLALGPIFTMPWLAAFGLTSQLFLGIHRRRTSKLRIACSILALATLFVSPWICVVFAAAGELLGRARFFETATKNSVASTFLKPGGHRS